jgi:hypothetical protein
MAFEVLFHDPKSGEPKVAHVSFFVWDGHRLDGIYNVKGEATQRALETARRELDNFVGYVDAMKQSPEFGTAAVNLDGRVTKLSDIDTAHLRCVACGPRGSRGIGFDEELRFSIEQIAKIAAQVADR